MMFLETTKTTQKTNSFRFSFIFLLVWFFYTFYASLLVLCILKKCEKKWLSFINLQERESTKEYVVYLVDASPKMFSTSSSAVSSFSLFFFCLYIFTFLFLFAWYYLVWDMYAEIWVVEASSTCSHDRL